MNDMSPLAETISTSLDAEQAVLGSLMVKNDLCSLVRSFLKGDHFSDPAHRAIYDGILSCVDVGRPATPQALISILPPFNDPSLTLGGYLAHLAASAYLANGMIVGVAQEVVRASVQRRAVQDAMDRVGRLRTAPDVLAVLSDAVASSSALADELIGLTAKPRTIGEFADAAIRQTNDAYRNSAIPGFTTGLATLDGKIGPIFRGDLVTLIADSGSGKTAAAVQILENAAAPSLDGYQASPSLLIEMEMKGVKIARRRLARDTGVSTRKQAEGTVIEGEFRRLIPAAQNLSGLRLYIDDKGKRSLADIEMVIRSMHRSEGIGMVAIDHVVLIEPDHPRDTDIDTIKKAAKRLKQLAMDLDIAVLVLAQTTREAQKRRTLRDLRPRISDIYGGEFLRQESDIVIGLCNPGSILPDMEPAGITGESTAVEKRDRALWDRLVDEWRGRAEIAGLKLRDGEKTGWARIGFDGAGTRFFDEDRR